MPRALLIVLDSVGIGGAPDAAAYGDEGADTLGHIAQACVAGHADRGGLRQGPLRLPHLCQLGLGLAAEASTGVMPPNLAPQGPLRGAWGLAWEHSKGKDTPSGHWEMMGQVVSWDWGVLPHSIPALPQAITQALINEAGLPGVLGNKHAPGVGVLEELGAEHLQTGKPILYTSVDSVLQIAAHEEAFGLERLYHTCAIARRLCDPLKIGRIIARPFIGTPQTGFIRTGNRKDYAIPPPSPTLLDQLVEAGRSVVSVGKIGDIFAHRSTGQEIKAHGNETVLNAALAAFQSLPDGGLVFANLVDFDTEYGHTRDVTGYAAALEAFDARLPEINQMLREDDICLITADHGNDPTWPGTDHTREQVPVLMFGPSVTPHALGRLDGFARIGALVKRHLLDC